MSKNSLILVIVAALAVIVLVGISALLYFRFAFVRDGEIVQSRLESRKRLQREPLSKNEEDILVKEGGLIRLRFLKDESGTLIMKTDGRSFGILETESGQEVPDFEALHDHLVRKKAERGEVADDPGMRVVIYATEDVDMKFVLEALKICDRAGIGNFRFSKEPTWLDELFDESAAEKTPAKHK